MKKWILIALCCFFIVGCASKTIPDWINAAHNHLENYKKNQLAGEEKIAELHFKKAIEEIKKSGDLELMSKAYLTKCAIQVALLEKMDDSDYLKVQIAHPSFANKNFHLFLQGNFGQVQKNLLPEQYHNFLSAVQKGLTAEVTNTIEKIEDPLSRLIAAGLAVRGNKFDERSLKVAIDTASANGWKKALFIYLERLRSLYETENEIKKAESIRQKIELIKN